MNLRPLLKIEGGKLDACARVQGTENCKKRLLEEMEKSIDEFRAKGWTVSVAAADSYADPSSSGEWLAMVLEALGQRDVGHSPLTCSIGGHVGPNAFGMAVTRRLT